MKKQFFTLLTLLVSIMAQSQTLAPNTSIGSYKVPKLEYHDSICGVNSQLIVQGHIARIEVKTFDDSVRLQYKGKIIYKPIRNDYYVYYVPVKAIYKNSIGFVGDTIAVKQYKGQTPNKALGPDHPLPSPRSHGVSPAPRLGIGKVFFLAKTGEYFYVYHGFKNGVAVARDSEDYPFRFGHHCFKKESQMYRYMAQVEGVVFPDSLMDEVTFEKREQLRLANRKKEIRLKERTADFNRLKSYGFTDQQAEEQIVRDSTSRAKRRSQYVEDPKITQARDSFFRVKKEEMLKKKALTRIDNTNATTINIRLTNPVWTATLETEPTSKKTLEFDIELSASSTIYLSNLPVRISYNENVFGTFASSRTELRYLFTPNSDYVDLDAQKTDDSRNVLVVPIGLDYAKKTVKTLQLTTNFKPVVHVKMPAFYCSQLPNVVIGDLTNSKFVTWYTTLPNIPLTGETSFIDNLTSSNFSVTNYCGPTITNFSPQTITAGTGSILTITGTGFGATKGELRFVNADTTSNKPETGINFNDLVWSDTKIEYKVHSVSSPKNTVVGSGNFRVVTTAKDSTDAKADLEKGLTVPYSVINSYNDDNLVSPLFHAQQSPNNGNAFVFYIKANAQQTPVLIKAIKDLRCYTGINFLYTAIDQEIGYGDNENGFSTLSFGKFDSSVEEDVLAYTKDYSTLGCNDGINKWFAKTESDILFKEDQVWNYDTTGAAVAYGQVNLYEVALHELGHAAGLDHLVSTSLLMKPTSSDTGILASNRYYLSKYSNESVKQGIDWLFSKSAKLVYGASACDKYYPMQRYGGACNAVYLADEQFYASIQILNNPTIDGKTAVKFQLTKPEAVNLRLVDMMGRELRSFTKSYAASEIVEEIDLGSFASGLYGLVIQKGNDLQMYRIVKH